MERPVEVTWRNMPGLEEIGAVVRCEAAKLERYQRRGVMGRRGH
jgi:hypothetical protein